MTQSDLDRLEKALAQGVMRVTFSDGRTVEFHTFEELVQRIEYVRKTLGQEGASRIIQTKFGKGVQC
jgi:hypothetical protein